MRRVFAFMALSSVSAGCGPVVVHDATPTGDGTSLAVVEELEGQYVVVRGERFGPYDGVGAESLVRSPTGDLAWAATKSGAWSVFIDGKAVGPEWDGIGDLEWSGDGSGVVYAARNQDGWFVAGPETLVGPFSAIAKSTVAVARSGPAFAFVGTTRDGTWVFHDDGLDGPYAAAGGLSMDDDGALVAFAASEDVGLTVHVGGQRFGPFADVAEVSVAPRLGRWSATVLAHDGWSVLLDGLLEEPALRIGAVSFSRSGARVAWASERATPKRGWWVHTDDASFGPYASVEHTSLALSPDDRHVAYVAREGEGAQLFVDGVPASDRYFGITDVTYASEAPVLAFVGKRDRDREIVVGGEKMGRWDAVSRLVLSPRGDHWLAATELAGSALVVQDGVPHRYDDVIAESLVLDASGTSWGGIVSDREARRLYIVVDGVRTTPIEMESLVDLIAAKASGAAGSTTPLVRGLEGWVRDAMMAKRRAAHLALTASE